MVEGSKYRRAKFPKAVNGDGENDLSAKAEAARDGTEDRVSLLEMPGILLQSFLVLPQSSFCFTDILPLFMACGTSIQYHTGSAGPWEDGAAKLFFYCLCRAGGLALWTG